MGYFLFFVAFVLRLTCIPGLMDAWERKDQNVSKILVKLNVTTFKHVMDDYGQNIWDTTDENCPLYFDEHEMINLRYSQYFYIASFMLATIRTLELCTASKHLGPKVYFGNLFYSSTHPQFNTTVPHKRATPFQFHTENP